MAKWHRTKTNNITVQKRRVHKCYSLEQVFSSEKLFHTLNWRNLNCSTDLNWVSDYFLAIWSCSLRYTSSQLLCRRNVISARAVKSDKWWRLCNSILSLSTSAVTLNSLSWSAEFRVTALALRFDISLQDRVWCSKFNFFSDFFEFSAVTATRGHAYILYKSRCPNSVRERTVNVWNFLPSSVNFSTLHAFKHSIVSVDFSLFMKCNRE